MHEGTGLTRRWQALDLPARLWWAAVAAVGTAAVVVLGAIALFGPGTATTATAAAPTHAPTGDVHSPSTMSGAMGAAGSTGSTGPSSTSSASDSSGICPNVAGATVMSTGMVMAPVPSGPPTAAQQAAADQLVAETTSALSRYASLSAATAAGYVPATNPDGYVVHYANWQTVRSGDVLDPSHPSALVYANTFSGPVLLGAMYMGPGPCEPGPDVGGSLTQWHAHDDLCLSATHQVVGRTTASGTCASGVHNTDTYFMLHVWTAPSLASGHQFEPDLTTAAIAPIIRSGQP
jgi:hypothetical protein